MIRRTSLVAVWLAACSGDDLPGCEEEDCEDGTTLYLDTCQCVSQSCVDFEAPPGAEVVFGSSALADGLEDDAELVLEAGSYSLSGAALKGLEVTLTGVCPDLVTLTVDDVSLEEGARLAFSGLRLVPSSIVVAGGRIEGSDASIVGGDWVLQSGSIDLAQSRFTDIADVGMEVRGGSLMLRDTELASARKAQASVGVRLTGGAASWRGGGATGFGHAAVQIEDGEFTANFWTVTGGVGPSLTDAGVVLLGGQASIGDSSMQGLRGPGVEAQGGNLFLRYSTFVGTGGGVVVRGSSRAFVDGVSITETRSPAGPAAASALRVQDQGEVTASELTLQRNRGPGVLVSGGRLSIEVGELSDNTFAGVWVADGNVALSDVTMARNGEDPEVGGGIALGAVDTTKTTTVTWSTGTASDHPRGSVYVSGQGRFGLTNLTLAPGEVRTLPIIDAQVGGHAVVAVDGVRGAEADLGLTLTKVTIRDFVEPAILLDDAEAYVDPSVVFETIADPRPFDILQQGCPTPLGIGGDLKGRAFLACAPPEVAQAVERISLSVPP
ncbi:MAG: hypothetical protein AAGA48_38085 [Myxococcota bacterium]